MLVPSDGEPYDKEKRITKSGRSPDVLGNRAGGGVGGLNRGHNDILVGVIRSAQIKLHVRDNVAAEGAGAEVEALVAVVILGAGNLGESAVVLDLIEEQGGIILSGEEELAGAVELGAVAVPEVQVGKRVAGGDIGVELGVEVEEGLALAGNIDGEGAAILEAELNLVVIIELQRVVLLGLDPIKVALDNEVLAAVEVGVGPVDVQGDVEVKILDLGALGLVEGHGADDVGVRSRGRRLGGQGDHVVVLVRLGDQRLADGVGDLLLGDRNALDELLALFPLGLNLETVDRIGIGDAAAVVVSQDIIGGVAVLDGVNGQSLVIVNVVGEGAIRVIDAGNVVAALVGVIGLNVGRRGADPAGLLRGEGGGGHAHHHGTRHHGGYKLFHVQGSSLKCLLVSVPIRGALLPLTWTVLEVYHGISKLSSYF